LFRLALALGRLDPFAMAEEMDEGLFRGWLQFWDEEPFGPMVENRMLARVAASVALSPGDEEDLLPRPTF
jgi:hypothetical protein